MAQFLDRTQIKGLIPHRGDSLLLNSVTAWEAGVQLEGGYEIPLAHPMLAGHFPGQPIWPGVLSLEGLAQAAATLTSLSKNVTADEVLYLFVGTESVRFLAPVVPPCAVTYKVRQLFERRGLFKFEGEVLCGDEVAATATFLAKMIMKKDAT